MPQLSEHDLEQMRRRLSAAALDLYLREGFEAVTLRGVAAALGISHTLPYRYFDNKDALFARVRADCFEQMAQAIMSADRPATEPLQRLAQLVNAYLAYVREHPQEYRLVFILDQPSPERFPELQEARRRLFDYGVGIIRRCVEQGTVKGDPRDLMHLGWAGMHGLISLHVGGQLVHGRRFEDLLQPLLQALFGPGWGGAGLQLQIEPAAAGPKEETHERRHSVRAASRTRTR
ncbi:MAG: TetR/AcrR family transcriptional regulator [Nevskia sp.]|nr:TetR/AcrR family transcriptional regulator [Nevskia sp.]